MWPVDSTREQEVLRVGRLAVERWAGSDAGLTLLQTVALPPVGWDHAGGLVDALRSLCTDKPGGKVTLLLESAWLPLLLAETGSRPWRQAQVEALLRHRLAMIFGDEGDPVAGWDLRVLYRPGDRFALGYGLPSSVRQAVLAAGRAAGWRWSTLAPALDWGWRRLRPRRRWAGGSNWWIWPEQDRLLCARLSRGRMVGLNAGGPPSDKPQDIVALVAVECIRLGFEAQDGPIDVATWADPPPAPLAVGRLTWHALSSVNKPAAATGAGPSGPASEVAA